MGGASPWTQYGKWLPGWDLKTANGVSSGDTLIPDTEALLSPPVL